MDFMFTFPNGAVTMSDVLVTVAAFLAGWTKYAQKAKDEQLQSRDATIEFLQKQIKYLTDENEIAHQRLLKMLEKQ
jgi:hypothetical protein